MVLWKCNSGRAFWFFSDGIFHAIPSSPWRKPEPKTALWRDWFPLVIPTKCKLRQVFLDQNEFSVQETAVGFNVLYKIAEKMVADLLLYKWDPSSNFSCALLVPVCEQMDTKIFSAQRAKAWEIRSKLSPRSRRQQNAPGQSEDYVDGNNKKVLVFEDVDLSCSG